MADQDPFLSVAFSLEFQGAVAGIFMSMSGLGSTTEVIQHKANNDKGQEVVKQIPGRLSWGPITLTRGTNSSLDIAKWREQVEDGKILEARKNGSIVMYQQDGTEVARWNFVNAWPSEVSYGDLSAEQSQVSVESVTIVHEGIDRIK